MKEFLFSVMSVASILFVLTTAYFVIRYATRSKAILSHLEVQINLLEKIAEKQRVTKEEIEEGLAIISQAISIADQHTHS